MTDSYRDEVEGRRVGRNPFGEVGWQGQEKDAKGSGEWGVGREGGCDDVPERADDDNGNEE